MCPTVEAALQVFSLLGRQKARVFFGKNPAQRALPVASPEVTLALGDLG